MRRFIGHFLLGFFVCSVLVSGVFAAALLSANRISAVLEIRAVPLDSRYEGRTAADLRWSWANHTASRGQP